MMFSTTYPYPLPEEELLTAKTQYVNYADKPPRLGGKVEKISIAEFERIAKCNFKEGVSLHEYGMPSFEETLISNIKLDDLKKQVNNLLAETCSKLAICRMGDFGMGVFALQDIPKNTAVAIFSGTIIDYDKNNEYIGEGLVYYNSMICFSTLNFRGIATFMQHLPFRPLFKSAQEHLDYNNSTYQRQKSMDEFLLTASMAYSTKFDSNDYSDVAFQNLQHNFIKVKDYPVIVFVANCDIKSGDQVGFDYSLPYWFARNMIPDYFKKDGDLFPRENYILTFGMINFGPFVYKGFYEPLRKLLHYDNIKDKNWSKIAITQDKKKCIMTRGELLLHLIAARACHIKVMG